MPSTNTGFVEKMKRSDNMLPAHGNQESEKLKTWELSEMKLPDRKTGRFWFLSEWVGSPDGVLPANLRSC